MNHFLLSVTFVQNLLDNFYFYSSVRIYFNLFSKQNGAQGRVVDTITGSNRKENVEVEVGSPEAEKAESAIEKKMTIEQENSLPANQKMVVKVSLLA